MPISSRETGGLLAVAMLCSCGQADSAPSEYDEPMLDIDRMSSSQTPSAHPRYRAVVRIECSIDGRPVDGGCMAGIVDDQGEDGSSLVEITGPGGLKRVIFVDPQGEPFGADNTEPDNPAGWEMSVNREGGRVTVELGPEHYAWPATLLQGD